jgi:hypothetical protein
MTTGVTLALADAALAVMACIPHLTHTTGSIVFVGAGRGL